MSMGQATQCVEHLANILAAGNVLDARNIANQLTIEIGTLSDVIAAPKGRLKRIAGEGAANAVHAFRRTMLYALRVGLSARHVFDDRRALDTYIQARLSGRNSEQVRVLFFDSRNQLICEDVNEGTIDIAPLFPREVVRRALEVGATGLMLAHNHPSGDPSPSSSDTSITRALVNASKLFDLTVHDHVIVGARTIFSMKAKGLL